MSLCFSTCGESDDIFDACLKVAQNPNATPAKNAIWARDMAYNVYEPKLVVPEHQPHYKPRPTERRRLFVE